MVTNVVTRGDQPLSHFSTLLSGKALDEPKVITAGTPAKSLQSEDVAITIDENLPLINRDTIITISASNWVRGSGVRVGKGR